MHSVFFGKTGVTLHMVACVGGGGRRRGKESFAASGHKIRVPEGPSNTRVLGRHLLLFSLFMIFLLSTLAGMAGIDMLSIHVDFIVPAR
jgi:hypothetical protein